MFSFQTDCRVELTPSGATNTIKERLSAVTQYLTPALLHKLRSYIDLLKLTEHTMSDGMQKVTGEWTQV